MGNCPPTVRQPRSWAQHRFSDLVRDGPERRRCLLSRPGHRSCQEQQRPEGTSWSESRTSAISPSWRLRTRELMTKRSSTCSFTIVTSHASLSASTREITPHSRSAALEALRRPRTRLGVPIKQAELVDQVLRLRIGGHYDTRNSPNSAVAPLSPPRSLGRLVSNKPIQRCQQRRRVVDVPKIHRACSLQRRAGKHHPEREVIMGNLQCHGSVEQHRHNRIKRQIGLELESRTACVLIHEDADELLHNQLGSSWTVESLSRTCSRLGSLNSFRIRSQS